MSVLIKGMETPEPGDMIVCALIDGKTQCTLATRHRPIKWCEAVEIPTPHGRLIDADELLKTIEASDYLLRYNDYITERGMFTGGIKLAIVAARTIIKSSENEERAN